MKNKAAFVTFITIAMFIVSIFASSTNPDSFNTAQEVGFPFIFYVSETPDSASSFSIIALLGNLIFLASVSAVIAVAIERLKSLGANRNLNTYP